jgi:hypothetical protein
MKSTVSVYFNIFTVCNLDDDIICNVEPYLVSQLDGIFLIGSRTSIEMFPECLINGGILHMYNCESS